MGSLVGGVGVGIECGVMFQVVRNAVCDCIM